MISYLEGIVKFKTVNYLTLLINGVGYKVFTPANVLGSINTGQKLSLFIHTHVKEEYFDLYGFETLEDLTMFDLLLGISGIGPKTALSIFCNNKLHKIREAIIKGDVEFFITVPRLGKKNAQKIIIELRSKLSKFDDINLAEESSDSKEIIDALKTFGFSHIEARDAYKSIKDVEGSTSDKIRQALKWLGKSK